MSYDSFLNLPISKKISHVKEEIEKFFNSEKLNIQFVQLDPRIIEFKFCLNLKEVTAIYNVKENKLQFKLSETNLNVFQYMNHFKKFINEFNKFINEYTISDMYKNYPNIFTINDFKIENFLDCYTFNGTLFDKKVTTIFKFNIEDTKTIYCYIIDNELQFSYYTPIFSKNNLKIKTHIKKNISSHSFYDLIEQCFYDNHFKYLYPEGRRSKRKLELIKMQQY